MIAIKDLLVYNIFMRIKSIIRNEKGQFKQTWARHRIKVICICGKEFETVESRISVGKGKYCSKKCYFSIGVSEKTRKLMSEKAKGRRNSIGTEFKEGQNTGLNNFKWKGDKVGYFSLHTWVQRQLGKAKECIECSSNKNVQWANKSHEYKRDITDWISLCKKCHCRYDKNHWGLATKKYNL